MEVGTHRDRAVAKLIDNVVLIEPKSAFYWATNIEQPALRNEYVEKASAEWQKIDPVAADRARKELRR